MDDCGLESGIELGQLVLGAGQADLQALDLSEPALPLSFGDPVEQVVADLGQTVSLGRLGPEERTSDASLSELDQPGGCADPHWPSPRKVVVEELGERALSGVLRAEHGLFSGLTGRT